MRGCGVEGATVLKWISVVREAVKAVSMANTVSYRAAKPMARVPKMVRRKISLARSIHCCPIFFIYFAQSASLYCEEYVYIHISDCVEIVCKVPLIPNNTVGETFLHKSGAVRSVDWIFNIGAPAWRWLGECVTLDKTYYSLLFKQDVVAAAPFTFTFSSVSHSLRNNNFTAH